MDDNQLPIFDWQNMVMGEGYRCLAAFNFEEAKQHFREASDRETEKEEEIEEALKACTYWHPVIQKSKEPSSGYSIKDLYRDFQLYDFSNAPGLQQFKNSLLGFIAEMMVEANYFYIDDNETVFDLLLGLRHYKKAERVVLQRMKTHPDDHRLKYFLAQLQWLTNKSGEAKKNYALALLYDPSHTPLNRIKSKDLTALINAKGPEMTPLYGWIRGILPLVPLQEKVKICCKEHQRAVDCYRLLRSADKALKKYDIDACAEYRKKLKDRAPDLYDEYYELLSTRHK